MDGQHEQAQEQQHEQMAEQQERNVGGRKQVKSGTTRRNARERNRVRHINVCFDVLRQHIPHQRHKNKLSKVDTLKSAINYIEDLRQLLENSSSFVLKQEDLFYCHRQDD